MSYNTYYLQSLKQTGNCLQLPDCDYRSGFDNTIFLTDATLQQRLEDYCRETNFINNIQSNRRQIVLGIVYSSSKKSGLHNTEDLLRMCRCADLSKHNRCN